MHAQALGLQADALIAPSPANSPVTEIARPRVGRTRLSVVSIGVMLVLIFSQVITRYFFGFTLEFSEELARYLFVWVVFLGSALIIGENGHVAVTFLYEKVKGTGFGLGLLIFIQLCGFAFVLLLLSQGTIMAANMMFQTSPALGVPMGAVYSVIPVSSVLMILYMIQNTRDVLKTHREAAQARLEKRQPAKKGA